MDLTSRALKKAAQHISAGESGMKPSILSARFDSLGVYSTAGYSVCGQYRYYLVRRFGRPAAQRPQRIAFIGLNPSTATERQNDPTVRRCIGFAQRWGFREFVMLNAFAFRSTDPRRLKTVDDPIGAANDRQIRYWTRRSGLVVCCWGTHAGLLDRDPALRAQLHKWGVSLKCFEQTQAGYPRHPLYLRSDAELLDFPLTFVTAGE
jgi:hypothetical protein